MSLFDGLNQISKQIQAQRHLMTTEAATIAASINPFISALGYNPNNLSQVQPEYRADPKTTGTEKVDFALLRDGKPVLFIEAKAAAVSLNENHWKQLLLYFNATDIRFGILTNGIEYRFYTDLHKNHIMDREPFLTIDMLNLEERHADELQWFTRSRFDADRIKTAAQRQMIARLLQQEMQHPSDGLVRHFARQVHDGRLSKADLQRYAQLVKDAWQLTLRRENAVQPPEDIAPDGTSPLEIAIFANYKGHRFDATFFVTDNMWLQEPTNCRFQNEVMNHAIAAEKAIQSVDPSAKTITGWEFWRFMHPLTSDERPLKALFDEIWKSGPLRRYFFG